MTDIIIQIALFTSPIWGTILWFLPWIAQDRS